MILFLIILLLPCYYAQFMHAQEYAQILHNTLWADFLYYDKQHTHALQWYENCIKNSSVPYPIRSYSLLLFDMKQFKSLLDYQNLLQTHFDNDMQIQKAIAIALAHEKKHAESATLFIKLAQKFPTSYDAVIPGAQILIQQGKLNDAQILLEKVINSRIHKQFTPIAMLLLAQVYIKQNNLPAAHTTLTQCIHYQPSYAPAWLMLGTLEELNNNPPKALNAYRTYKNLTNVHNVHLEERIQALTFKQNSPDNTQKTTIQSDVQHALTLIKNAHYTTALTVIKNGLKKNNKDTYLRALYIHVLVVLEQYPSALIIIKNYIQENPADHTWWGALHILAVNTKTEKQAYNTLNNMRLHYPHIIWGYLYEADYILRRKQYAEAHKLYADALYITQHDPLRAEIYFMQALCGYELCDYTLVAAAIEKGLSGTCVHAPLHNLAAYYYAHCGDYTQAAALIMKCCTLEPHNQHYKDTAAFIAYKKGDIATAEKICTQLHYQYPTDATISLHTARIAHKKNNLTEYRKLLAHAENHAYSRYEERRIKAYLDTGTI